MKIIIPLSFVALLFLSCATTVPSGRTDSTASIAKNFSLIKATCFEVVAEKPSKDSLSYEKPLRWDLLDFAVRNDKYIPLGTAFAISPTELVTAAHVLSLTDDSMEFKTRFIREKTKEGDKTVEKVYEIEDVHAFSTNRDYVVFTVKGRTFDKWLKIQTQVEFNKQIFTAGDAYGEGIVVRDGILLDQVPEGENGAWNYLKSSIATNPGNSGGPLLDANFNVIGIVLSRKDDFCYSLPMKEIVSGKAIIHTKSNFGFTVFNKQKAAILEDRWDLPMRYADLTAKYSAAYSKFYVDNMNSLLAENDGDLFPKGKNALKALYDSSVSSFPEIYLQDNASNEWFLSDVQTSGTDIGKNGTVTWGQIYKDSSVWLMRIFRPSDVTVRQLYDSPKLAMDTLLKGINIPRKITDGDQGSRIISYGEPIEVASLADRYGRPWKVSSWLLEFEDRVVITLSTPTPRGLAMIYVSCDSSQKNYWLYDLSKIVDYIGLSYFGSLEEWGTFLDQKDFLFGTLKDVALTYKENDSLDLHTRDYSVRIDKQLMNVTKKSNLFLGLDVFPKNGNIVLDLRKTVAEQDENSGSNNYCVVYRWSRPVDGLKDTVKDEWQKSVMAQGYPYNSKPYSENGRTNIGALHPAFVVDGKVSIPHDFAYTVFAAKEGAVPDDVMGSCLQALMKGITVAP